MIDLRRVRGTLAALALLGALLVLSSSLLHRTIGRRPREILGSDWSSYTLVSCQSAGGRVSGVLKEGRPSHGRLGILLGASTLEWGVDPVALGSLAGGENQWLSLYGKGCTGLDLERMADLAFGSGLRPEALVLAIYPGMLARSEAFLADPDSEDRRSPVSSLLADLASRRWSKVRHGVLALSQRASSDLLPQGTRINNRVQYGFLLARRAVLEAFGEGSGAIFTPTANPWSVDPEFARHPHATEEAVRKQLSGLEQRGWFAASSYADGTQGAAIRRVIQKARAHGSEVFVVLMPESTKIREAVPREAVDLLRAIASKSAGGPPATLLDLRESMPDTVFQDATHLDLEGRKRFTGRLARALSPHLAASSARKLASRR